MRRGNGNCSQATRCQDPYRDSAPWLKHEARRFLLLLTLRPVCRSDSCRGRGRGGGGGARTSGYIQVREEEIADDYPVPREYAADEEEGADECDEVLVGGGFGLHPDDMPEQTLDRFAFYNADVSAAGAGFGVWGSWGPGEGRAAVGDVEMWSLGGDIVSLHVTS